MFLPRHIHASGFSVSIKLMAFAGAYPLWSLSKKQKMSFPCRAQAEKAPAQPESACGE
jgi:hypothetical protein